MDEIIMEISLSFEPLFYHHYLSHTIRSNHS